MCWESLFIRTTWAPYVAKSVLALIKNPTLTCVTASTWATPAPTAASAMPVACCASTLHCLRQRLAGPLLDREGGCQHPSAAVTILTNSGQPTVSVPAASRSFSSRWRWRPSNPCPAPSWVCWRTDPWPGTGKNSILLSFWLDRVLAQLCIQYSAARLVRYCKERKAAVLPQRGLGQDAPALITQ